MHSASVFPSCFRARANLTPNCLVNDAVGVGQSCNSRYFFFLLCCLRELLVSRWTWGSFFVPDDWLIRQVGNHHLGKSEYQRCERSQRHGFENAHSADG